MSDDVEQEGVIFINRFTLAGSPEEFEAAFAQTSDYLRQQPGLLEFTLLQSSSRDVYVNVARWQDAASLHKAVRHPRFAKHAEALRLVSTSQPDLFTARQTYSR